MKKISRIPKLLIISLLAAIAFLPFQNCSKQQTLSGDISTAQNVKQTPSGTPVKEVDPADVGSDDTGSGHFTEEYPTCFLLVPTKDESPDANSYILAVQSVLAVGTSQVSEFPIENAILHISDQSGFYNLKPFQIFGKSGVAEFLISDAKISPDRLAVSVFGANFPQGISINACPEGPAN